jgi:hypothetical protein
MTTNTLPPHVHEALRRVLAYATPDEARHYEETPVAERRGHIYECLMTVSLWLDSGEAGAG